MVNNYGRAPGHLQATPSVIEDDNDESGLRRRNAECRAAAQYRGQVARDLKADGTLSTPKAGENFPALIAGQGRPVDQLVRALHGPEQLTPQYGKRKRKDKEKREEKRVGLGITLEKLFGVSGRGMAALVNVPAVNGAEPYQSVLKVDKKNINDVEKEEGLLQDFQGCRHIVQYDPNTKHFKAVRSAKTKPNNKSSSHYKDRVNIGVDWKRNFVMMEYAELGSLKEWLQRTSAHAADPSSDLGPWPDKALWQLLECLTLGLVGMAYAPHGREDEGAVNVVDETIPPARKPHIRQRTHFDLDPGNVFVNSIGKGHNNRPTYKIGDFGVLQDFSLVPENENAFPERKFWQLRGYGKPGFYFPEQFCREWDDFRDFMGFGNNENKNRFIGKGFSKPYVAGNYGMASNVFQVGIILWMAITLHVPPGARVYREPQEDAVGVVVDSVFMRRNGQTLRTYGGALEDERFSHVEEELRELVIRCMAHDPADRPDLAELTQTIRSRLRLPFPTDGAELNRWYNKMFARPSPEADRGEHGRGDDDDDDDDGDEDPRFPKRPRNGFSRNISNERVSRGGNETASLLTAESLQTLRDALGIAQAMQVRAAANPIFAELVNVLQRVPGIAEEQDAVMHGGRGDGGDAHVVDGNGEHGHNDGDGGGIGGAAQEPERNAPSPPARRETRAQAKRRAQNLAN